MRKLAQTATYYEVYNQKVRHLRSGIYFANFTSNNHLSQQEFVQTSPCISKINTTVTIFSLTLQYIFDSETNIYFGQFILVFTHKLFQLLFIFCHKRFL